jgi:putative flavoprotein involved in K+ transport
MLDTLVVGAGQAGLAAAHHLRRLGRDFRIVESNRRIGEQWRRRYASLSLFTPRFLSQLPGIPMAGDRNGFASSHEFADYLEMVGSRFPLETEAGVRSLRQNRHGGFTAITTQSEAIDCRNIVVTTGGFQIPVVPRIASGFGPSIRQYDPDSYAGPANLPEVPILVVGDGASGRDIAAELALSSRDVILATGRRRRLLPQRILGVDTWWWLDRTGLLGAPADSTLGRLLRNADAFPDRGRSLRQLRRLGVSVVPRLASARDDHATLGDGSLRRVGAVIWCVGYRDDVSWVHIPGASNGDGFLHQAGVSPVPGLFFVGRPWQRNRASGLIAGVGEDARLIVDRL